MKKKARELYEEGLSIRAVAAEMGLSYSAARKALLETGPLRERRRVSIPGEAFCLICEETKEGTEFTVRRDRGTYAPYCRACYNKKYNAPERRAQRRGANKYEECPACSYHRRQDSNGICWRCNLDSGLRQCSVCEELLPEALSFSPGRTTCKSCRGRSLLQGEGS